MTFANLVANRPFALPHRQLVKGEILARLQFKDAKDLAFFRGQLRWNAFAVVTSDKDAQPDAEVEAAIAALQKAEAKRFAAEDTKSRDAANAKAKAAHDAQLAKAKAKATQDAPVPATEPASDAAPDDARSKKSKKDTVAPGKE